MPTRNVSLSGHYDSFIESNVKSGCFDNASEVFRAGLRLLEQQQEENDLKLENLRQVAKLGFKQLEQGNRVTVSDNELESIWKVKSIVVIWQHYLSLAAEQDIIEILAWSEENFGELGRIRYEKLIIAAIRNLSENPEKQGVQRRDEVIENARLYHLIYSRKIVAVDLRVNTTRHFILFRIVEEQQIEIARLLHDRMDIF